MSDVTRILAAAEQGDPHAAQQLLPLVYDELRKLAAARLAHEKPGQTLDATALVHEAYVRLVDVDVSQNWNSRGHFFGAAAEAMRRILVENARRKARGKHGGDRIQEEIAPMEIAAPEVSADLLALDEALDQLVERDPQSAELVKCWSTKKSPARTTWNSASTWRHAEKPPRRPPSSAEQSSITKRPSKTFPKS
ncbi:MAG: ECF-type sigma factor [Pirellulales bacterium]